MHGSIQTTHPEHDEGREALVNFDVAINSFIKKWLPDHHAHLLDTDDNDGERLRRTVKRIATDYILAHTTKAVEEAESRLTAKMQSEIVSPAIDDDFGTYDYKMVAENALNFIEKRLSTPTLKGRQPHDPAI